jgi:hypothetical protein
MELEMETVSNGFPFRSAILSLGEPWRSEVSIPTRRDRDQVSFTRRLRLRKR